MSDGSRKPRSNCKCLPDFQTTEKIVDSVDSVNVQPIVDSVNDIPAQKRARGRPPKKSKKKSSKLQTPEVGDVRLIHGAEHHVQAIPGQQDSIPQQQNLEQCAVAQQQKLEQQAIEQQAIEQQASLAAGMMDQQTGGGWSGEMTGASNGYDETVSGYQCNMYTPDSSTASVHSIGNGYNTTNIQQPDVMLIAICCYAVYCMVTIIHFLQTASNHNMESQTSKRPPPYHNRTLDNVRSSYTPEGLEPLFMNSISNDLKNFLVEEQRNLVIGREYIAYFPRPQKKLSEPDTKDLFEEFLTALPEDSREALVKDRKLHEQKVKVKKTKEKFQK